MRSWDVLKGKEATELQLKRNKKNRCHIKYKPITRVNKKRGVIEKTKKHSKEIETMWCP